MHITPIQRLIGLVLITSLRCTAGFLIMLWWQMLSPCSHALGTLKKLSFPFVFTQKVNTYAGKQGTRL